MITLFPSNVANRSIECGAKPLFILLRCYQLTEHTYNFSLFAIVIIYEFQVHRSLILKEKVIERIVRSIKMTYSKRIASLASSLDFDRLVSSAYVRLEPSCSFLIMLS